MALIPSDLERLKKSAINFLYVFISPNAKGLSAEVMNRRAAQIEELKKIYSYGEGYTWAQMINIIRAGILQRYGRHPEEFLQHIYNITVRVPGVGSPTPGGGIDEDMKIENLIKNMSTNVTEGGSTQKKSFWEDVKSVIEWLVGLFERLFGRHTDPNVYQPQHENWTYNNRPIGEPQTTTQSSGWLPAIVAGGILYGLWTSAGKADKNKKKK